MANWAWPHAPADNMARLVIVGADQEPAAGLEVGFVPPDTAAPVQIVWSTWTPWGFTAHLYEWHGETLFARGRTDALIYRVKRVVAVDEMPPLVADAVDVWADAADLLQRIAARPVRGGMRWGDTFRS